MVLVYQQFRDAGSLVYIAGQTPQQASGAFPHGIEDQVAIAVGRIDALLSERGLGLGEVSGLIDPLFRIEIEAIAFRG